MSAGSEDKRTLPPVKQLVNYGGNSGQQTSLIPALPAVKLVTRSISGTMQPTSQSQMEPDFGERAIKQEVTSGELEQPMQSASQPKPQQLTVQSTSQPKPVFPSVKLETPSISGTLKRTRQSQMEPHVDERAKKQKVTSGELEQPMQSTLQPKPHQQPAQSTSQPTSQQLQPTPLQRQQTNLQAVVQEIRQLQNTANQLQNDLGTLGQEAVRLSQPTSQQLQPTTEPEKISEPPVQTPAEQMQIQPIPVQSQQTQDVKQEIRQLQNAANKLQNDAGKLRYEAIKLLRKANKIQWKARDIQSQASIMDRYGVPSTSQADSYAQSNGRNQSAYNTSTSNYVYYGNNSTRNTNLTELPDEIENILNSHSIRLYGNPSITIVRNYYNN